jgi:2,4'-dihydroxyacetophenone dioxygenase
VSSTIDDLAVSSIDGWQPVGAGFHLKLLRGAASDNETRALLLRLAPGTEIPLHRHTGEVHAINLAGTRQLFPSGRVVKPGEYVYEPPGNVDSWRVVGSSVLVVFVTVQGELEYLDDKGAVIATTGTASISESYAEFLRGKQ